MGILNLTPDSFYDGGKNNLEYRALYQTEKMIGEGAAIIDMGAVSTRPDAVFVDADEEWKRLSGILSMIRKRYPDTLISVDTYRSKISRKAVEEGADIINDISGGRFDEKMYETIAELKVPYVMMHIKGTPQTMQANPVYTDVVAEIYDYFKTGINALSKLGVDDNIVLDPGFGFGKTVDHNYKILMGLKAFQSLGFPVLAGLSRKSMINRVLDTTPAEALNGTTVLNTIALLNGANILRVHDVKEAVEVVKIYRRYQQNS
nr:dihydropteroate synthase [Bacteroidota bacterium]